MKTVFIIYSLMFAEKTVYDPGLEFSNYESCIHYIADEILPKFKNTKAPFHFNCQRVQK